MCFKRHRRVAQSRIVSITFFVVVSLLSPARAQTMKFTYDAVGNLIERTTIACAAPQILRQPRPNVVTPGNSASFVVVVNDTRGVTYQWRLNGVEISGATSDVLFIPSVVGGDAGNYTVAVTNTSGTATSNSAALLLDTDDDGLPDTWEAANSVNSSQNAHTDADGDGVNNIDEFFDGTDPTGSSDFRARLDITAHGGSVAASPTGGTYPNGQVVALTATPDSGSTFYGWTGDVSGTTNPINITMSGNKSAVAHFRCTPIPSGAAAYWRGETDGTDTVGGNTGQFYNGTTVVSPSVTTGRIGNAFNFTGSLHVRGSMPSTLRPREVSVELWVYPNLKNASYQTLLQYGPFELDLKNGKIQFWTANAPTGQSHLVEGPELPLNQWTHVAAVLSGEVKTIFVNGLPAASATGVAPLLYDSSANNFTIGGSWVSGAIATRLTGRIDEVGLYWRALYESEILEMASAGPAPKCQRPYFTTPDPLPDGIAATPYSQALNVVVGTLPIAFSLAVGSLPPGLTLSSSGAVSGTPSEAGDYSFIVRAVDANGVSADQVYGLVIRGPLVPPAALVAWWRGESGATDSAGLNHGTFYNGGTPVSPTTSGGLVGSALSFDGNVYTRVPAAPELTPGALTLEAWVYPLALGTRNEIITRPSSSSAYALSVSNGVPRFWTSHVSAANQSLSASSTLPIGAWSHVAATFEDGVKRLYVNGTLAASESGRTALAYDSPGAPITVGGSLVSGSANYRWNGKIDEASIYRRALSAGEVNAIYVAGAAGKRDHGPRFSTAPQLPDGALARAYSESIVATGGTGPLSYWVNEGALPPGLALDGGGALTGTPSAAGTFQFVVAVMDTSVTSEQLYRLRIVAPHQPPAGLVAWWRGESDAEDAAGQNDGTFYSGTTAVPATLAAGRVGGALSFDGSIHVAVPDAAALQPAALSVEAWLYPTAQSASPQKLFARAPFSGSNDTYALGLVNGIPNFWTNHVTTGAHQLAATNAPIAVGAWTHVGATFDGFAKRIFVNGKLVATAGGFRALSYATQAVPITLGGSWRSTGSDHRYVGRLDELSLYDRALTDAEVADVFDASLAGKQTSGPRYAVGSTLSSGTTGSTYSSQPVLSSSGPAAVTVAVSGGALPPGLVLGSNGVVSGRPTAAGDYWWEITATDATGASSSQKFDVRISSALELPLGAVGWWRAEGDASDALGTNHGTLVNGAAFASGKVGQAFTFEGVEARVSISESAITDISRMPAWTVEAWVFPVNFNGSTIYSEGPFAASLGLQASTGRPESWINNSNKLNGNRALTLGAWNHVAMTYDATGRRFYVNGYAAGQGTAPAVTPDNAGAAIGDVTDVPGGPDFPGSIDEVTVYARALTADEIAQIYLAGSGGKSDPSEAASHFRPEQALPYAVVGQAYEESLAPSGLPGTLVYEPAGGAIPPGLALASDGTLSGTATTVGAYAFLVRATDPSGATFGKVFTIDAWRPVNAQTGLVAWWRAENNGLDSVGSNNGTLTNGTGFATGRVGQAFSFDGVDDRVAIAEATSIDLSRMSAFSMEAWIYPEDPGSQTFPTVYSEGRWVASMGLQRPSNKPDNWINNSSQLVGSIAVSLNAWSHLALTYDQGTRTFYVNGVWAGSSSGPAVVGNSIGSAIGDLPSTPNASRFKGRIDELGIYNRTLTRAEVAAIYGAGPLGKASAP